MVEIIPKALLHFHFYGFGGGSGEPDKEGAVPLALAMLPLCVVLMEGSSRADGLSLIIRRIVTLPYVGFMESEVPEKHGHVPVFDRISEGFQQN